MITTRVTLHAEATWWRTNGRFERLIVVDWIAAIRTAEADHWDQSYTKDERIHATRGIQITWAPTGTAEIIGWVENDAAAEAIIARLETLLEMAGPLS